MSTAEDAARQSAILRLAFGRKQHPELGNAEAEARINLAVAIMAMDETEDQIPGHHNLREQQEVNQAIQRYAEALADLLRGDLHSVSLSRLIADAEG